MSERITEADLLEMESTLRIQAGAPDGHLEHPVVSAKLALQLVAELRRLRWIIMIAGVMVGEGALRDEAQAIAAEKA